MSDQLEAVLFDVDGTLMDTNYWHVVAWDRAFAEHGVPQPAWRLHAAIGMGGDRLVAAVAGDEIEQRLGDDVRAAWKRIYDEYLYRTRAFDGAQELLERTHEAGLTVVLASSGNPQHLDYAREQLGPDKYFDHVLSGEDVEASKPAADLFALALQKVGLEPAAAHRVVVVGDTRWDVESARALGIDTVGLLCGGRAACELREAGAVETYDDPAQLVERFGSSPLGR
ncbi:HAD family hydrolase [Spongisporangium articulatum]|uniref:HAD family hydrolase n=1 Tax=Spongisporangium articulatum TaxID=3362603 RepID=A0ABW8AH98_9ACTN